MLIARGRGVATVRNNADFHDVGPVSLIVEEAGGKVTSFNGEKLVLNKPINNVIISNSAAHLELIAIINS